MARVPITFLLMQFSYKSLKLPRHVDKKWNLQTFLGEISRSEFQTFFQSFETLVESLKLDIKVSQTWKFRVSEVTTGCWLKIWNNPRVLTTWGTRMGMRSQEISDRDRGAWNRRRSLRVVGWRKPLKERSLWINASGIQRVLLRGIVEIVDWSVRSDRKTTWPSATPVLKEKRPYLFQPAVNALNNR
jgi:hypothetical protein